MRAEERETQTILVTGATGRLGRHLVNRLLEEGYTVRALSEKREYINQLIPGVVPFVGTMDDARVLEEACKGVDVVFHLAAIVDEHGYSPEDVMRVNVEDMKKFLQICKRNDVKHFIFTSSVTVYGIKRKEVLDENARLMPSDRYGHSKMMGEQEIMKSGVPYTILRITNIYGPGFERSFFKVLKGVWEGKMVIIGDGKNHLSLVHVGDVINSLILTMEKREQSVGKIYNITDGDIYTQQDLIDLAATLMKVKKPTRHVSEFLVKMLAKQRNLDSGELRFLTSDRIINISRAETELGYKPVVDIKRGEQEVIDLFLSKMKSKS